MGCACKFLLIKKGRKATSPAHGPRRALRRPRAGPSGPTHLAPRGADLPVAAEAQLAGLGAVGPGQVPAALQRHGGATRPELLPAAQLAVLGARATGAAAGCPVAGLPAVGTRRAGKRQTETWVAKPEVRGAAMCREGHAGVEGGDPQRTGACLALECGSWVVLCLPTSAFLIAHCPSAAGGRRQRGTLWAVRMCVPRATAVLLGP